ncbi:MAG: NYN domain-containing protein [Opitutaceae bacterium]|nr:NYN domain-containing protein [Opitutaceae bacterium]
MHDPQPVRHVLVDFENVPHTTLAPIAGMEVEVTLLLGEKNKRLDVALVEQILAASPRVQVVRVGATGRNALDLTLAYYLGRAAVSAPRTHFTIVSRDKDYDPLIRHARSTGLEVERCESMEALSFLPKSAKPSAPSPARPEARATPRLDARAEAIAAQLRDYPRSRPGRRTTLLRFIKSNLGGTPTDDDASEIALQLERAGCLAVSPKGSVTYRIVSQAD